MLSLRLRGLSYSPSTATCIFDSIDLDLVSDDRARGDAWIGVVGPNGSGKTTLLRLLAGCLEPTAGHVSSTSAGRPVLVAQEVGEQDADVTDFAATWDGPALKLRGRLDLDPEALEVATDRGWHTLSPGQRKRWQVAAALHQRPDVLLLDEPTNHLDGHARELVLDALTDFRGLGLIVSHDRDVLERLTSRTLRIGPGVVELHAGAYTEASARWRADEETTREEHAKARRHLAREQAVRGDLRRDRHSAEAAPRRERRLADPRDSDARETGRKMAQAKAEAALARRVTQMNARVGRAEARAAAITVTRERGGDLTLHHAPSRRPTLVSFEGDIRHAGGAVQLADVRVDVHRGEHVHVTGPNGAGKTTLLRTLLDRLDRTPERVVYLAQELDRPAAAVRALHDLDLTSRGRVLGAVATLGVDPDRLLQTDAPSPGEARKLVLAHALIGNASMLVLDEPTNHLDLPSIERLEAALAAWDGALVLVTHDLTLAAAATTTTWSVEGGRVEVTRPNAISSGRAPREDRAAEHRDARARERRG